jgi:hypothetical protein
VTRADRFWAKVARGAPGECWRWTGAKNSLGYGNFGVGGGRVVCAHRVAYEFERGPIPDGKVLDHLCRVPSCVNPSHLEAVTQQTNVLRGVGLPAINAAKQTCRVGHEYVRKADGSRYCRECHRLYQRARSLRLPTPRPEAANG